MNEEMLINRICAGHILHEFDNQGTSIMLKLGSPTIEDKYYADYLATTWYSNCFKAGVWSDEETVDYLVKEGIWSYDKELELNKLKDGLQELKVNLYEMRLQSKSVANIRVGLKESKKRIEKLENLRGCLFSNTCEFLSRLAKQNYLSMCNIRTLENELYVNPKTVLGEPCAIFNQVLQARIDNILEETDFRRLARSDYWHSFWNSSQRLTNLFGVPTTEITLEQQHLVIWSHIYDNINEHSESPPDEVLEDDDMLDGWMIIQKRKNEGDRARSAFESKFANQKGSEVFVKVDSDEDARKVMGMNDAEAAGIIKQRMNLLNKKGIVNEMEMPDVKNRLIMEANQKFRNQVKGQ